MYRNFDDDHIGDDEFDDLMDASRQALTKDIINHINKNKDNIQKFVGDIVQMWDTSRLTDHETNEFNTDLLDHEILVKFPSIVVEDDLIYNADIVLADRLYPCNLDLVIWNKILNKKFRTRSEFVKITTAKP
jgi:hypothetical protein